MNVTCNRITLLAILLLMVIGSIIYANTMDVPFYFDDMPNIKNEALRLDSISFETLSKAMSEAASVNRPVSNLSFALNYYLGGYKVQGYHLINISIHLLTAVFLFLFLRVTLILPVNSGKYASFYQGLSFLVALIWLVHPLGTQSVTYIVQRMNSMAAMFYVLALLLYVLGRSRQRRGRGRQVSLSVWIWFVSSGLSGVLAIASKEIAVTLPVMIFIYEWYFFQDLKWDWLRKKISWFIGAGFAIAIMAVFYLGKAPWQVFYSDCPGRDFTAYERLLTQFRVVIRYISLLLYPNPDRLAFDYNFPLSTSLFSPVTTLYSFLGIMLLLLLAVLLARRERLLSFCIFWFLGNLVLESSVICLEIIYEHRTYLPSMLFFLLPVALLFRIVNAKKNVFLLLFPIILCFAFWTVERNKVWQDPFLFWEDNLAKQPEKARLYNNFALELYEKGEVERAEAGFRKAIELIPQKPYPQLNLGELLWKTGRLEEAERYLLDAVQNRRTYMQAYLDLAELFYETDRPDGALLFLEEAYALDPDHVGLNSLRGNLLLRSGNPEEALKYLDYAIQNGAAGAEILSDQGEALLRVGRLEEALHAYEMSLKRNSRSVAVEYNLAMLYQGQGDSKRAMRHFQKAVKLDNPGEVPVQYNYANFLYRQQYPIAAKRNYEIFLNTLPYMADAYNNLGLIYVQQGNLQEAMGKFREALQISPQNELARKNLELVQSLLEEQSSEK